MPTAHTRPPLPRPSGDPPAELVIAADTEFDGAKTLTVQLAARLGPDDVALQVYHADDVPAPPAGPRDALDAGPPSRYAAFYRRLARRPPRPLAADLSPAAMARDLLALDAAPVPRADGLRLLADAAGGPPPFANLTRGRDGRWRAPEVRVTVVTHYQRADFFRMFGATFLRDLKAAAPGRRPVEVRYRKVLRFADGGGPAGGAVVQFLRAGDRLYAVRVGFRDTRLAAGGGSLDDLSRAHLGVGKDGGLGAADKGRMADAFRDRPADAYRYAAADAVNTLLVDEGLSAAHRDTAGRLGLAVGPPPGTAGGRARQLVEADLRRAAGVAAGGLTPGQVGELMAAGGAEPAGPLTPSKFGPQPAAVHGGLLLSRSPTRFWHEAPGRLRDVDLRACYPTVLAGLGVYWGRPVVLEPGGKRMTLQQAVELARRHADDDAWVVWASGPVVGVQNVLIPSTHDAVTTANYRSKAAGRARAGWHRAGGGRRGGARLYAREVAYGAVTAATWRVIELLPPAARAAYERLAADTVVMHPRRLVARTADEYRRLTAELGTAPAPWEQEFDEAGLCVRERRPIDAAHVALRQPVDGLVRRLVEVRDEARRAGGRGCGAELAAKTAVNAVYGALASPRMPTFNPVAANQVTARARALAFLLTQGLNAVQTITDGCTYRADQVPAGTFDDALRARPGYPARRAEGGDGVGFLPAAAVPADDPEFNEWLPAHLARFFATTPETIRELLGGHAVEHKADGGRPAFDALGCDGAGNYIKCVRRAGGGWEPVRVAARGVGRDGRGPLAEYLVATYSADRVAGLPPPVADGDLLAPPSAAAAARAAVQGGRGPVLLPVGWRRERAVDYRLLKPSAFLFDTAAHRAQVVKAWAGLEAGYGCGLEVLALRRGYRGRKAGSLADLAEAVERVVRRGGRLAAGLNAHKLSPDLRLLAGDRRAAVADMRDEFRRELEGRMAVDVWDWFLGQVGVLVVDEQDPFLADLARRAAG